MTGKFVCILSRATLLIWFLSGCSANWHLRRAIAKDPSILQPSEPVSVLSVTPEINFSSVLPPCVDWPDIQEIRDTATGASVTIERVYEVDSLSGDSVATGEFEVTGNVPEKKTIVECPPCNPSVIYKPRAWWEKFIIPLMLIITIFVFVKNK